MVNKSPSEPSVRGVYTAIVTPFDAHDVLDVAGLRENVRLQLESGVDGIVALGTTAEAPTLTPDEKKKIVVTVMNEVDGRVPVMVGTGSYSTKQTIAQTQEAKAAGAHSALIVTPYYNKPTQEGIYLHFKAVAEAVDIPIMVYNIQGRTGQNIQTDTLKRLAEIPNIIGVKEASGNILQISEVIEQVGRFRPDFSVMCGDDTLTLAAMALGAHGVISVVSNLIPHVIKQLVTLLQNGDYNEARALHHRLMPLIRAAFIETNPMPIKALMRLCGMAAGECRLPLCALQPASADKLKSIVKQYEDILTTSISA